MSRPPLTSTYHSSSRDSLPTTASTSSYYSSHHHPSSAASHPTASSSNDISNVLDRVMGLLNDEDDTDCPLCLEEMDISDLNFKPCPCGYQICRFCWHHIKENLNGLCPACRAPYDDETVEFKAIKPEELKRLQAAKKIRDKRRKDDALTMKNMANVRVRQRAQVHVQGMTTKIANEDTLNQLKATEHFGQYGTVVKLFMSKRSSTVTQPLSTHPHYQPVNVYVNYRTPAEASRCITALDGTTTEDGHKLKAIWGTTRYCPTYLKGGKCNNGNCMQAHEPGEEIEGLVASRDEMLTFAASDSEGQRSKASNALTQIRKQQEAASLPAAASWASKNATTAAIVVDSSLPPLSASIRPPHVHPSPAVRPIPVSKPVTHPLPARPTARKTAAEMRKELRSTSTAAPSSSSTSSPTSHRSPEAVNTRMPPGIDIVFDTEEDPPVASSSSSRRQSNASPFGEPSPVAFDAFSSSRRAVGESIYRPPSIPFPELNFGDDGFDFSMNLDVKGKKRAVSNAYANGVEVLGGDEESRAREFDSSGFVDQTSFQNSSFAPYIGSFDPFSDTINHGSPSFDHMGLNGGDSDDLRSGSSSPPPSGDDSASRRSSRFGFARRGSHGVMSGPGGGELMGAGSMRSSDLGSAFARSAFTSFGGSGRESPVTSFAPPGLQHPQQQMRSASGSSVGGYPTSASNERSLSSSFNEGGRGGSNGGDGNGLSSSTDPAILWPGINLSNGGGAGYGSSTLPPAFLRSLANSSSPTSGSNSSSPQLSPRMRANMYPSSASAPSLPTSNLPPGISLNRPPMSMPPSSFPLPAASFPLPPPAPRPVGVGSGNGKNDLLAMIAAAQKSGSVAKGQNNRDGHPFSDPAILNARLASPLPPPTANSSQANGNSNSAAYHSLMEGMTARNNSNGGGGIGNGFDPQQLQQQAQQRQQLAMQQMQQQQAQQQMSQYHYNQSLYR